MHPKSLEFSKIGIFKVASHKISNSDIVGVKLQPSIFFKLENLENFFRYRQ